MCEGASIVYEGITDMLKGYCDGLGLSFPRASSC